MGTTLAREHDTENLLHIYFPSNSSESTANTATDGFPQRNETLLKQSKWLQWTMMSTGDMQSVDVDINAGRSRWFVPAQLCVGGRGGTQRYVPEKQNPCEATNLSASSGPRLSANNTRTAFKPILILHRQTPSPGGEMNGSWLSSRMIPLYGNLDCGTNFHPGLTFDSFRQSLKSHLLGDRSA